MRKDECLYTWLKAESVPVWRSDLFPLSVWRPHRSPENPQHFVGRSFIHRSRDLNQISEISIGELYIFLLV